jgi:ribosomal protein S18 acetylase RimI-like enzyme
MIKTGNIADIDCVLGITKSCARHMIKQGVYQWNEQYPDRDSFVNDVKNNELYVYLEKEKVVGCISLCNEMDEVYMTVRWKTINLNNLYIHRLAVHPNFQKKGVGKALMDFAENFARKKDYESVRLDTFSKNKRNLKFYKSRGYHRLQEIYFPKQSEFPFYCYELIL